MISVCMASYNGEKYIREQIESILSQLSSRDELIISDDASTDSTCSIIESFHDPRIKLLHHNPCGLSKNFENAMLMASGDYIFLSDQDDVWLPTKVSTCMDFFAKSADLVLSDAKIVDKNLKVIEPSLMQKNHSGKGIFHNIVKSSYVGCCMAFKKDLFSFILPFPSDISGHDMWIGLMSEFKRKKIFFYVEPLILFRRHGENFSPTCEKSPNSILKKINFRLGDLKSSFLRLLKYK